MWLSRVGIGILALVVMMPILAQSAAGLGSEPRPADEFVGNVESKVQVDSAGSIHVLWAVPSLNKSGSSPGLWYSKYASNGSDSIPPTLIQNSSSVQSADMAVDKLNQPHIAWTEGPAFGNNLTGEHGEAGSQLYYARLTSYGTQENSTSIVQTGGLVLWPSLAVDDNMTAYVVWTQVSVEKQIAGAYYTSINRDNGAHEPVLIASFNQTSLSIPRTRLAFSPTASNLHVVWIESDSVPGGGLSSSVSYARLDLNAENVTRIVIARYDQSLQGASVTAGPAGNAYIAWEEGQPGPSASVYVAQVSRDGQLAFVRQLSSPNPLGSRIDYVVSADSQDNLYLIWYQPNVPNIPNVDTSASRVLTSVAYLKLDRDGAVSQSGNELVEGPVLAVTVSTTGDVYAISRQGIVNVTQPTAYWSISPILASVAAASAVGGASMVEELRYRAAHSAVRALGVRKRSKTTSDAILKTLCRKPGLTIGELKHLVPTEKPSMLKLAMLENEGYISSVRIGLRRRFYGSEQLMSPENPSSGEYDSIPLRILHEIEQNPGTWEARLSQTLGLSQQIVHYHLKKLQTSRIISAETVGKRKQYRLGSTSRQELTAQSDMPT